MRLYNVILKILNEKKGPLSVLDVMKELKKNGYRFSYVSIKKTLDKIALNEEHIIRYRRGRTYLYTVVDKNHRAAITLDKFISFSTLSHIEKQRFEHEAEEAELKVFRGALASAVEDWISMVEVWEDILEPKLRENNRVLKFAAEDPRRLAMAVFKAIEDYARSLSDKFQSCKDVEERRKIRMKGEYLERKVFRRVASYFGVPPAPKEAIFKVEYRGVPVITTVDHELLRRLIEENIVGDRIIERFALSGLVERIASAQVVANKIISVGIDGTRYKINAGYVLSKVRALSKRHIISALPPIYIHAAVASWIEEGRKEPICDPRPLPEDWAEYTRSKAVGEGLILTPRETEGYSENIREKATEAALNAVEYEKLRESFDPPSDVLGRGGDLPHFAFLDGRLYPYEHTFDDYIHDHHEQVALSFRKFNMIISLNDIYNRPEHVRVLICGLTKTSELNVFRILLAFWLRKEGVLNEEEFWKVIQSPLLDGYLVWKIFSLIDELEPEEGVLTTFRVRKPFFSLVWQTPLRNVLNEGKTVDEKVRALRDQELWEKHLREYAEDRNRPVADVTPFAVACTRGYILYFYIDAPYFRPSSVGDIFLPRFEILVPYSAALGENLKKFDQSAVSKLIALLRMYNWFVFYKSYESNGPIESRIIVTREVNSAHEHATMLGRIYLSTIYGMLEKTLIKLLGDYYGKEIR